MPFCIAFQFLFMSESFITKQKDQNSFLKVVYFDTGKSLSEAHIFASTNPQYDDRLLIELRVQYLHENCKLRTCCVL